MNKSRVALRRLTFTNFFDRTCNMILSHVSPVVGYANINTSRLNNVLSQAKYELREEKKSLKALRRLIRSGETPESDMMLMLGSMENMQKVRHIRMQNMIESTRMK